MPITHIYMPENRRLLFHPEVFLDSENTVAFFPKALEQEGAELTTHEPGTTTDITPAFMQNSNFPRYFLEMGDTRDTAMVHELPGEVGSGSIVVNYDSLTIENRKTLHISETADCQIIAVPIKTTLARFGAAILFWSDTQLEEYQAYWQPPKPPLL